MGMGQYQTSQGYQPYEYGQGSNIKSEEELDEPPRAEQGTSPHHLPLPAIQITSVNPIPIENPVLPPPVDHGQRSAITQIAKGSYIAQAANGGVATVVNNMIDAMAQEDIEKVGNLSQQLDEFRQDRLQGTMSQRLAEVDITKLESIFKQQLKTVETEISQLQIDRKTHQDALEQLANAQQAFDQRNGSNQQKEEQSFFGRIFGAFKSVIRSLAAIVPAISGNLVVALVAAALLYIDAV